MKNLKMILCVSICLMMTFAELSNAQGWGRGGGRGIGMGRGMGMYNYNTGVYPMYNQPVNLTQDQIAKMNEIDTQYQTDYITLSNKLNLKYMELQNLQMVNPPDYNAINHKIEEVAQLEAEVQKKSLEYDKKAMEVYTPEQRQMFNTAQVGAAGMVNPYYCRGMGGAGRGMAYGRMGGGFGGGGMYYGTNVMGGVRRGRGPCGLGLNKPYGMGGGFWR